MAECPTCKSAPQLPLFREQVRRQLIDVCKQSCQGQQGNLVIYPYRDVNPTPSFENVISTAFGGLTPNCAYDLMAVPMGKVPILEETYATEASTEVCTRLQQLINKAQAHSYGTTVEIHQYLKDYYSPYYDLEDHESALLYCQSCNGVWDYAVELPPFMDGNYKIIYRVRCMKQKKHSSWQNILA